jgi:glycosyltransferase involved in cell wall biosynthesis
VQAACRLKEMGFKDFLFVLAAAERGEGGMSRYACETWDQVLAANAADVCRIVSLPADRQAAFAAATVAVSAALQPEGTQRGVLEALAMELPIVVSDMAAGPDIVLAPPAVTPERMTGLRFSAGDGAALTAAVIRMFALPDKERHTIGARGRDWVRVQFAPAVVSERMLRLYDDVAKSRAPASRP